jgi:hypothetical protein
MRRLDSATPLRCARNDPVNENRVACSRPLLFAQTQQRFPVNPFYLFRTAVRLRGNDGCVQAKNAPNAKRATPSVFCLIMNTQYPFGLSLSKPCTRLRQAQPERIFAKRTVLTPSAKR